MKVYEIATGYTPIPARRGAATEIVVENLTRGLLGLGIPTEILDLQVLNRQDCGLPIREVPVPRWLGDADTSLGLRHKLRRVVYSLCLAKELKKLLKSEKHPIVLHFHNQYNLFFFLLLTSRRLRRKALIAYTNHSGIWRLPWAQIRGTIARRYFQEALAMKAADLVFVLNEETRENLKYHLSIPAVQIVTIRNGVDVDVFHPLTQAQRAENLESLGLTGKTVILQAGSVCENKGQLRTLETLAPLLKAQQGLVFAYVGAVVEEDYQSAVEEKARQLGLSRQVRWLGTAVPGEEMNRLYDLAAATVLSSRYEGYPLVAAEALAAGAPVVTPFPIGPGCADSVEDALARREELAEAGLAFARQELTWTAVARDYAKTWEDALCQKSSTER